MSLIFTLSALLPVLHTILPGFDMNQVGGVLIQGEDELASELAGCFQCLTRCLYSVGTLPSPKDAPCLVVQRISVGLDVVGRFHF